MFGERGRGRIAQGSERCGVGRGAEMQSRTIPLCTSEPLNLCTSVGQLPNNAWIELDPAASKFSYLPHSTVKSRNRPPLCRYPIKLACKCFPHFNLSVDSHLSIHRIRDHQRPPITS